LHAAPLAAQTAAGAPAAGPTPAGTSTEEVQEVVVTGYRRSLQDSTDAKKAATGFSDAIFAEDIGKFPDTNVAESFNRIPGIQIVRDATGQGVNVAIRGLGSNFTKVLLNGAPVAIASTGPLDNQNSNREVDLNMFPTELFTQLTVQKSASAAMLEGGVSGTVDMRSARPFDHPGPHLTYSLQGTKDQPASSDGWHGSILASDTFGPFGVLAGFVDVRDQSRYTGFETIGWTNPNITAVQCGPAGGCNGTGGGNWTIPATVPTGLTGLPSGTTLAPNTVIDNNFLTTVNPGATIQQIDNGIIPRLGRTMDENGTRDRYNGVVSLEYRPTDFLHLYVDSQYGREYNDLQRFDMDWVGRNGASIPLNEQFDQSNCSAGCTVTKGTFANSQFFLEYRPYKETTDFWGVNPGLDLQFSDDWKASLRANDTHSTFHRESPSVLAATATGLTVNYVNDGGTPSITSSTDLNNPANFQWNGSARVNIQDERRVTDTKGVRLDLTWGHGGPLNFSVGGAYDDIKRTINAYDASQPWQNATCGGGINPSLPGPNVQPPCQGLTAAAITPGVGGYPSYPYLGHGYTSGVTGPVAYSGSLITQAALPTYLVPTSDGFVSLNWPAFAAASNYAAFHGAEGAATSSNTGAGGGLIEEKATGLYGQFSGTWTLGNQPLRYTAGARWVKTDQLVGGAISEASPLNNALVAAAGSSAAAQGSLYPNVVQVVDYAQTYYNLLPAGEVAYNLSDNAVVKFASSKTMTRPNPSSLLPGASFSSPSADIGTLGNTALKPYLSTNLDLGVEYYLGGSSYWSVTAFRKRITGFTSNLNLTEPFSFLAQYGITYNTLTPTQQGAITARCANVATDPTSCNITLTEQVNASGAVTINGYEVNYVQSLDLLLGRWGLNGFGFNFNFTLIDQFGSGAAPAIALGVAPHSYNLTLYYENDIVSARLSTVFNAGSQGSTANQNGIPLAAIFSNDYQQWDFSSSLDIGKLFGWRGSPLQATFDVTNIFSEHLRQYFQFADAPYTDYNPGRTIMLGVRGKL
jgi:TonB-dependent receptor